MYLNTKMDYCKKSRNNHVTGFYFFVAKTGVEPVTSGL